MSIGLEDKMKLLRRMKSRDRRRRDRGSNKRVYYPFRTGTNEKISDKTKIKTGTSILSSIMKYAVILLIVVIVIWGCIYIYKRFRKRKQEKELLNVSVPANKPFVIENTRIPTSEYGNEYTLSYWMYVNDWEFKNKLPKSVLFRGDKNAVATNPGFWFYPENNKLKIVFQLQSFQPTIAEINELNACPNSMNPLNNPNFLHHHKGTCNISDVPLQRWNHICVSIWNQSVDVYLNGKLVRSCVMREYPVPSSGDIHIGYKGGFNGYVSTLDYYPHILKPEDIYAIYTRGPKRAKKDVEVHSDGDYAVVV